MRLSIFFCLMFVMVIRLFSQETILHQGINRTYYIHLPAGYNPTFPYPLVFNLHGFGSNALQQQLYTQMDENANENGYIVCYPEGTELQPGVQFWNIGITGTTSIVDDVAFIDTLIEVISAKYSVNSERIYSCGMSNGGFMSYFLACALSDKIAAIASVTGSMTSTFYPTCNPSRPVPILEMHGTADGTVPFEGGTGIVAIDTVMRLWVLLNGCAETPQVTQVPDTDLTDGSTVERFVYSFCNAETEVRLDKVIGGEHTWPGGAIPIGVTNYDMDGTKEIWEFFDRFDINGKRDIEIGVAETATDAMKVYPNPSNGRFMIHNDGIILELKIFDLTGRELKRLQNIPSGEYSIQLEPGSEGIMYLQALTSNGQLTQKIVVNI